MIHSAVLLLGLVLPTPAQTSAPDAPASAPASRPADGPWWEHGGLVVAASFLSPEEQTWLVTEGRTDAPTRDELAEYDGMFSDAELLRLRSIGVNLVVIPYGGYGPDATEAPARRRAAEIAERCRRLGLRVGLVIPIGSIDPRRWQDTAEPVAEALALDHTQRPFQIAARGRLLTSRRHPWEQKRAARLITQPLLDFRPDLLVLPDFTIAVNHEPAGARGFRGHVRQYRAAGGSIRQAEAVERPPAPPKDDDDPSRTEAWMDYRAQALADELPVIREFARCLQSNAAVALRGANADYQVHRLDGPAVDPSRLWPLTDFAWCDTPVTVESNGRIRHQIIPYKMAAGAGVAVVCGVPRPLEAAQALAFGGGRLGCLGYLYRGKLASLDSAEAAIYPEMHRLARFSRDRRELFDGLSPVRDVVVCRSAASAMYGGETGRVVSLQTENALIRRHIPFTVAVDVSAADDGRVRAPVMLLAGAERLSDADVAALTAHVHGGGGLVLVGECGTHDEAGRRRDRPLSDLLIAGSATTQTADSRTTKRWTVGRGRVAHLDRPARLDTVWLTTRQPPPGRPPPIEPDPLRDAIEWALGRPIVLDADFSPSVASELTTSETGDRIALHRVNYDRARPAPAVKVTLRLPSDRLVESVTRYAAGAEPARIVFDQSDDAVTFHAAELTLYDAHLFRTTPNP